MVFFTVHVEAGVRILGCACDADESWGISFDEFQGDDCSAVQEWMFGQTIDQEGFDYIDANNDGQVDGEEAANAWEQNM